MCRTSIRNTKILFSNCFFALPRVCSLARQLQVLIVPLINKLHPLIYRLSRKRSTRSIRSHITKITKARRAFRSCRAGSCWLWPSVCSCLNRRGCFGFSSCICSATPTIVPNAANTPRIASGPWRGPY